MAGTKANSPAIQYYFDKLERIHSSLKEIASNGKTPLYVFDKKEVQKNYRTFVSTFKGKGLDIKPFYATKSNYYIGILKTVAEEGGGIDVASQRELKMAIEANAKQIVYTGPSKTRNDFELITQHCSKITVNLESLRELYLLSEIAIRDGKTVKCGVRIYTVNQSGWIKFGIPINDLKKFFDEARKLKGIDFCGIHFHISFNCTPERYVATFKELGKYLKANFSAEELKEIKYLDIGGGILPQTMERVYSWNPNQLMQYPDNDEIKFFSDIRTDRFQPRTLPLKINPFDVFTYDITKAYEKFIRPLLPYAQIYAEPGRFISHSSMHLLASLIDIKEDKFAIADGGNNMVGWEKYQYIDYSPCYNLSQFDLKREIPFITYGSLCTPDDIWGYYMYTKEQPKEGDIILLPFQGAYTYTLAQNFIKEIPPVYDI
jgi:diaminopimelate decarboxylase